MKKFLFAKKNNDGSTMLFVLVSVMFIGLLATLITALSVAGFKMKNVDYLSKKNFYEGEEYTSKIYNEFGMNAVGILGEAYVSTMGNINSGSITSKDSMNNYLMNLYYKNMLIYLKLEAAGVSDTALKLPIKFDNASSQVSDPTNGMTARIQSIVDPSDPASRQVEASVNGDIYCIPAGLTKVEVEAALGTAPGCLEYDEVSLQTAYPVIIINDVHLTYVKSSNNYESDYTFDIVIRYPDWDFTFANPVSASSDIDTFLDYVLISNDAMVFNGVNEGVHGCVSAGTNGVVAQNEDFDDYSSGFKYGIQINSGAQVHFYENGENRYEPLAIVATDNVTVNSTLTNPSYMAVHGGKLWCNSVILNMAETDYDGTATGSTFTTSSTKLYIQDDLQLDGDFSTAIISGGSYYGYSTNSSTTSNTAQNSSSAIMVNGNKSSVSLSGLDVLSVNGLAYLNFKNKGTLYRTGESITVKGTQVMYLVPDDYMYATTGTKIGNPVKVSGSGITYTADQAEIASGLTDFFGYSYLKNMAADGEYPFIVRNYTINGSEYAFYYLNFKSTSAQGNYVKNVLNSSSTDSVLLATREKVLKALSDMNETAASLVSASASSMFTAGAIVTANGGEQAGTASASGVADVVIDSMNLRNKYLLMKSILVPVPDDEIVVDFSNVVCKDLIYKNNIDSTAYPSTSRAIVNQYLNRSAVDNIIDTTKLQLYAADGGGVWSRSHADGDLVYINSYGGEADVTSYTHKGVVVVNGDAVVKGSFTGLIIATGRITVSGSGELYSSPDVVEGVLTAEQSYVPTSSEVGPRSDVFRFYPCATSLTAYGDSIDQLDYSDVIYYDNWRRY
jgi:hypothetical protein